MTELLIFRLHGPLASWGEIAIGQERGSALRPTRSALLGLVAAALGIERPDESAHAALADVVRIAVRVDHDGIALVDYHTTNWRLPRRERIFTRREELRASRHDLSTVQSNRHYRCDALCTVGIHVDANARWSRQQIREALENPTFPLYLGRKACVLALPLAPRIVEAATLHAAFDEYDQLCPVPNHLTRAVGRSARERHTMLWAWDVDLQLPPGFATETTHRETRRDAPISRTRRRFTVRDEIVARQILEPR